MTHWPDVCVYLSISRRARRAHRLRHRAAVSYPLLTAAATRPNTSWTISPAPSLSHSTCAPQPTCDTRFFPSCAWAP